MTGKTKGPDNNKRLAQLEEGLTELKEALGGEAHIGLDDPFVLAIAVIEAGKTDRETVELHAKRIAELEAELAKGPDGATEGEIAALARAEAAERELAQAKIELEESKEDLERLASEKGRIANELAELIENKGYKRPEPEAAADPEPEPEPRERPEGARDFGPTFCRLSRKEIAELVEEGAKFEVGFSNGSYEIVELAPVEIEAKALAFREGRFMLSEPIQAKAGEYPEKVHGAVLIHDGEQVDYCQFPTALAMDPGQIRQFVRVISFGELKERAA